MVKIKVKAKGIRGRGKVTEDVKKDPNTGLTGAQTEWLKKEAKAQGIPMTMLVRRGIDWYISAVEQQRGDSETNKLFDMVYKEQDVTQTNPTKEK